MLWILLTADVYTILLPNGFASRCDDGQEIGLVQAVMPKHALDDAVAAMATSMAVRTALGSVPVSLSLCLCLSLSLSLSLCVCDDVVGLRFR